MQLVAQAMWAVQKNNTSGSIYVGRTVTHASQTIDATCLKQTAITRQY